MGEDAAGAAGGDREASGGRRGAVAAEEGLRGVRRRLPQVEGGGSGDCPPPV